MNTTRMVVDTYTQWEDCWYCFSWYNPFQRKVLKHRLVPVLKVENITKVSLVRKCCEGFIKTEDGCGPLCTEGCGYGRYGNNIFRMSFLYFNYDVQPASSMY